MYLVFIALILFLCIWIVKFKETFGAVPYNTYLTYKNSSNVYEKESEDLTNAFNVYFKNVSNLELKRKLSIGKFTFGKSIKKELLKTLKIVLNDPKVELVNEMFDISWDDDEDGKSRLIKFNIYIKSIIKGYVRNINVLIRILNVNNYLLDNGDYSPFELDGKDVEIVFIGLEQSIAKSIQYKPYNYASNDYRILNKLGLLDPYMTSGKDMQITDNMKEAFSKALKEKPQNSRALCYGTINVYNKMEECEENGGTWDTPPVNDQECPYFKANKNYPNTFGGKRGDTCELPKNMKMIGVKRESLDPKFAPLCYNCSTNKIDIGTLGYCCSEPLQPGLTSPDYAFVGDSEARSKYNEHFLQNKLSLV